MNIEIISKKKLADLEELLGYSFKNQELLVLAATHSSFANEKRKLELVSNERLEFLGDAVLNIVVSEKLYKSFVNLPEGELSKIRASIVCEASLALSAEKIKLGSYLLLGKGEESTGGRTRASILSDAFEAIIGSIYLDSGLENARTFILGKMSEHLSFGSSKSAFVDYKTQLQEIVQKNPNGKTVYTLVEESGPAHDKRFIVSVDTGLAAAGTGEGKSKKEAEQSAAHDAILKWKTLS